MSRVNPFFKSSPESYTLTKVEYRHFELEFYIFNSDKPPIISVWDKKIEQYNSIGLIYYMSDVSDIKEDIIETIDEILVRKSGDEILGNNFTLISVIVEPEMSFITSDNDLRRGKDKAASDLSMQLSTDDFRSISVRWIEFLENIEKQAN